MSSAGSSPPSPPRPLGDAVSEGRLSIGSRASSLGILQGGQMLDFSSCSSLGSGDQQLSPVDVAALESTIAQLQHSGRALREDRDRMQLQLEQLEESNSQLALEQAQLTEKNASMTVDLQRIPCLRQEVERLQGELETEARQRALQREQTARQERLVAAQQHEINLLASKLSSAELEASRAGDREGRLRAALEEARRETELLERALQDGRSREQASQGTIAALTDTVREMRDTSLALQQERSRTCHQLSSVKKQLQSLRRSTPAAGDASRSGPASLQNNGSIHDEIINTIQTTGDGDPVLPLSGIASPELVHAICASPLNLHFKTLPRRLRLTSTPESRKGQERAQDQERSPPDNADESAELDDRYFSAALSSHGSSGVWRSLHQSVADVSVQTETPTLEERGSSQTEQQLRSKQAEISTQTKPRPLEEDGSTQTEDKPTQEDSGTQTEPVALEEHGTKEQRPMQEDSSCQAEDLSVLARDSATQTVQTPRQEDSGTQVERGDGSVLRDCDAQMEPGDSAVARDCAAQTRRSGDAEVLHRNTQTERRDGTGVLHCDTQTEREDDTELIHRDTQTERGKDIAAIHRDTQTERRNGTGVIHCDTQTERGFGAGVLHRDTQTEPCENAAIMNCLIAAASGQTDVETVHQTTQTGPLPVASPGRSETESEQSEYDSLPESEPESEMESATEAEPSQSEAAYDQDAQSTWLWSENRLTRRPRSATTRAATSGEKQAREEGGDPSAVERRRLLAGDLPSLLLEVTELLHQKETMFPGGSCTSAGPGLGMKRTQSDGALSAPLRTRFCSMPTVEEVPDDPDTDIPQHSPLRASFSLPCDPNEVGIFPSLTEHMLADLHFHSDENANNTNEKDLESKFSSLALAFKTDRLTLHERLDVQRRHRDQAEQNLDMEAQHFREQLMLLSQSDADRSEQLKSLQRQLDIIKQISHRLSRTAEVLGAAQQELRVSRAVEVMTQHVESLRHLYEREHAELEEARRVLATNNIALHEPAPKTAAVGGRRRASIAVFAPRSAAQPLAGLGGPLGSHHPGQISHHSQISHPGSPGHQGQISHPGQLSHSGQLSPTSGSPTAGMTGLRRRRNSLGAGDADGFSAIREEREEGRVEPERSPEPPPGPGPPPPCVEDQLQGGRQQPDGEEGLLNHVEEAVSDELASLRSEQEQLANDLKTLLARQRDAVLQQTTSVGNLLYEAWHAWPYSREQTVVRARYCVGGLFLLLAVVVLLVPPAYTSCHSPPAAFYSWAELLSPHLSLRHVHRPPL